jgi:hypothetical protein
MSSVGGVLFVICLGCAGVGYFAWTGIQQAAAKAVRQNDLNQIGVAYHNHEMTFKRGPQRAEDLAPYLEHDAKILGRLKSGDIVFLYGVSIRDMLMEGTANTVLAYEKEVPEKEGFVLTADGAVHYMTAAEFATKHKARAGGAVANLGDQDKVTLTKIRLQSAQQACQTFKFRHGRWPGSLLELTQPGPNGEPALLAPEALLDTWGQMLIIDVNGGDANRPLIYSPGAPGGKKISNLD